MRKRGAKYVFQIHAENFAQGFDEMKEKRSDLSQINKSLRKQGIDSSYNAGYITVGAQNLKEMDEFLKQLVGYGFYDSYKDAKYDMEMANNMRCDGRS